jgi:carbon storage regulator CsrA
MLVLSRRPEQGIVFPNLGVTIQILSLNGHTVKVGIEAPSAVKVRRQELPPTADETAARTFQRQACHSLCNSLGKVTLALHLFEKQWEAGLASEARQTLDDALAHLEKLDREWVMDHFGRETPATPARKLRTLVVDDDPNERELLAGLLSMNGCECETAADGEDALEYLAGHELPDFVLLDMWMPRCDGPQTISRIRGDQRLHRLKIFTISSTAPEELGVRTGPEGFDAWFPKPLNPRRLWRAMQENLGRSAEAN